MSWLERILPGRNRTAAKPKGVPEGVWVKCPSCEAMLYSNELKREQYVCPKCGHHHRIGARERLESFLTDAKEIGAEKKPSDILKFKDLKKYKDRLSAAQKQTGEDDALVAMSGLLHSIPVVACAFEFKFMGGSMGTVVGARFVKAVEVAIEQKCPLIAFSASGGARMQEALFSLMQMAKTSAALAKLRDAGLPYISVLTDPTMGGVSASLAMLGDLNVAEPNALIGFAGPRVIEQTVREKLPKGFQRSEFLLAHGAVDMIVDRRQMQEILAKQIAKLMHLNVPASLEETPARLIDVHAYDQVASTSPNQS